MFNRAIIFVSLFVLLPHLIFAESFSDVQKNHKNYEAIEALKKSGVIKGYPDLTFKPNNTLNRAEALKIFLLGTGINTNISESKNIFPDVPKDAWFTPYVIKARALGIIKGDPKGMFLPENQINLAECLKILLLTNGTRVPAYIKESPYADVNLNDWFAPYFAYASEKGLLDQKKYEQVSPGHNVTRGEIAEIMYRLKKILDDEKQNVSFASYYSDVLHGSLTASGEKYDKWKFTASHKEFPFGSRVEVINLLNKKSVIVTINDRGPKVNERAIDLSKIAFESISPLSKEVIPVSIRLINEKDSELSFSNDNTTNSCDIENIDKEISKDFFINKTNNIFIELYSPLRKVYNEYEVIDVSGKVFDEKIKGIWALIKDENGQKTYFFSNVINGDFIIQIEFGSKGNKSITFLTYKNGDNYLANINVTDIKCNKEIKKEELQIPNNYRFAIENNNVIFRWDIYDTNLSRIIFKQGNNQVIRYFSSGKKGWKVNLSSFDLFSYGEFFLKVETSKSSSGLIKDVETEWVSGDTMKFIGTNHLFLKNDTLKISINDFPNTYLFGVEISFKGKTKTSTQSTLYVISPSEEINTVQFGNKEARKINNHKIEYIEKNQEFVVQYTPKEHGTHLMQIYDESENILINLPVYEQDYIPIIPNYNDISNSEETDIIIDNNDYSQKLLNLINQERLSASLERVELNDSLSYLAQEKANDMVKNKYISHWNTEDKDINDLKIQYGIKTEIVENIAEESSILDIHYNLIYSSLHLKKILNKYWTRCGFGFAKSDNNKIIAVELFSSDPIEEKDLPKLREETLELINSKREKFLVPSATLESLSQTWSDKMATNEFFDFKDIEGNSLSDEVRKAGILKTVGTFIIGNQSWDDLLDTLLQHEELFNLRWNKFGIGITQDNDGIIKVTILYSE